MNSSTVQDNTEQRKKRRVAIAERVNVTDAYSGDTGYINSWSITF